MLTSFYLIFQKIPVKYTYCSVLNSPSSVWNSSSPPVCLCSRSPPSHTQTHTHMTLPGRVFRVVRVVLPVLNTQTAAPWAAAPAAPQLIAVTSHRPAAAASSGLHFNSDTERYLTCPGPSLSHDPSVCSRDQHFHLRPWHRISLFTVTLMDMLEQSLDTAR